MRFADVVLPVWPDAGNAKLEFTFSKETPFEVAIYTRELPKK